MNFNDFKEGECLYRYEEYKTAAFNLDGDYLFGTGMRIALRKYKVLRRTPKGCWIHYGNGEKFVLLTARKRFACPTIEEAAESFLARKNRQQKILESQLNNVKSAIREFERMQKKQEVA